MAPISNSVEIDRSPADVFAYVTDIRNFPEWQDAVVSAELEGDGPVQQGSRFVMTRKMGGQERTMTTEMTDFDPPSGYGFRVLDGPVRAVGKGRLEPLDDGKRTRLTVEVDFEGHGIGKLLVPLVVRRQAGADMPKYQARLKQLLESGAA